MKTKKRNLGFWAIVWGMGLAGQLCWNMENQWFNTFVYAKISGDVNIVTWMVIVSALVTTVSTFVFGTWSDRIGKRRIFVSCGYIIWGITTILFGMTEFARDSGIGALIALSGALVVLTDAVMSFFGSMAYDSGFSVWLNDHTHEGNAGQVGAALAVLPILSTVIGTVVGGMLINIGNPTVGTANYDPGQDNYQLLFWTIGIFVIVTGIASIFFMKDHPDVTPHKHGTFGQQLISIFQMETLKRNPHLKEMFLACAVNCAFFIPFNFYFTHLGNWMIYDIGLTAGDMGLVEGISLLLAALFTIPFAKVINNGKIPQMCFASVFINAAGLFGISKFVTGPDSINTANLFSPDNLHLFIFVFLVGVGFVLISQAATIWVKMLFPEENRGALEGMKVIFFTLIPMFAGTLIGNFIIKHTPQLTPVYDVYGHVIDVPQENLFGIAGIMVLLTLVPLYFGGKLYRKRMNSK